MRCFLSFKQFAEFFFECGEFGIDNELAVGLQHVSCVVVFVSVFGFVKSFQRLDLGDDEVGHVFLSFL